MYQLNGRHYSVCGSSSCPCREEKAVDFCPSCTTIEPGYSDSSHYIALSLASTKVSSQL